GISHRAQDRAVGRVGVLAPFGAGGRIGWFWRTVGRRRAGGRIGWFWRAVGRRRAGGRIGWFWSRFSQSKITRNGLAVDPQFVGDPTLRPAAPMECTNGFGDSHFEQVRHGAAPRARNLPSEPRPRTWISSKWLVFKRPFV